MFANTVQPALISIFSSTSSNPLQLFSSQVDSQLPEDSVICLVDDSTSNPVAGDLPASAKLISVKKTDEKVEEPDDGDTREWEGEGYTLAQRVLHIQSPTLKKAFVRCPRVSSVSLGITLPHLHVQVRSLGREWSFEVGVLDRAGRSGVIRCSTFQKEPTLNPSHTPPLLHLPLHLPPLPSTRKNEHVYDPYASNPLTLTAWSTVSLNLPSLMDGFSRLASSLLARQADEETEAYQGQQAGLLPNAGYASIRYVKVYATCRLRRVWASRDARGDGVNLPWELGLYGK